MEDKISARKRKPANQSHQLGYKPIKDSRLKHLENDDEE